MKNSQKGSTVASSRMNQLEVFSRIIFDTPRWLFLSGALLILVLKVGISPIPNFFVVAGIATNPFHYGYEPDGFYQMWNWLTPYLAWLTNMNTGNKVLSLHFALAIAFIGVVISALFRKLPEVQARTATIIFLTMPVSGSVLYWICYDAPALFLMALAVFVVRNRYVLFLLGILLGLQDFEPTVVAFGALLLAAWFNRKDNNSAFDDLVSPLSVILGALLGRLVLTVLFNRWGLHANSGRLEWFKGHFVEMRDQVVQAPWLCLWAVLGLAWIVLAAHLVADIKITRSLVIPLALLSVLVFTTADKTRVMAVATFPLLSVLWLQNEGFLKAFNRKLVTMVTLVWLVVPWIFIWCTTMYTSTSFGSNQGFDGTWKTLQNIFGF